MKKGFTLIESILVITLIGILSFVFAVYIGEMTAAWRFLSGQKSLAMSARSALYRLVHDIKLINTAAGLRTFSSTEVVFNDIEGLTVAYSQEGHYLRRNGDIALDNLKVPGGLNFTYLDADLEPTASRDEIRAIRIKLTLARDDNKFSIGSAARLRLRQL